MMEKYIIFHDGTSYDWCMKGGLIVKSPKKKHKVLMGVECFDLGVLSDQH